MWSYQLHKLQGIDSHATHNTTLKALAKDIRQGSTIFAICSDPKTSLRQQQIHLDMQQLIREFEDLFEEPKQLTPVKNIDHQINLKEGSPAINVRAYRYAYIQKVEIEK